MPNTKKPQPQSQPNTKPSAKSCTWHSWLIPAWLAQTLAHRDNWRSDILAGLMMGVLVIPQSLGYAALAGLPPVMGLYAAIVPTLVYAYIGASSVQAVGPVAVTAIMTAGALSGVSDTDSYVLLATTLAWMVGIILCVARVLKLGWIMQFISRGVSAGFISAASVLIILGQLKHLIGLPLQGDGLVEMGQNFLSAHDALINPTAAIIGIGSLIILLLSRYRADLFWGWLPSAQRALAGRLLVIMLVVLAIILSLQLNLAARITTLAPLPPFGMPVLNLPSMDTVITLLPSAALIAFVAFVSTAAISHSHALRLNEPYHANHDLTGLGFANLASGLFGGFAVAGGISRTSLNVSLGARTPLASVLCALVILFILWGLADLFTGLPYALLSAIIVSSVISMIDVPTFKQAYHHDKADMVSFLVAFFGVCLFGLNVGLVAGLLCSFACLIYRSRRVHMAVVGQVDDSAHFRNVLRHRVRTFDRLLLVRIDESLYFGNAALVQDAILAKLNQTPKPSDVVLIMTAVNHIDLSAQAMLVELNRTLIHMGKRLHYAEIKGPVLDAIGDTPVLSGLSGQVFLSTIAAVQTLSPDDSLHPQI